MASTPMIVEGEVVAPPQIPVTGGNKPKGGQRRGKGSANRRSDTFNAVQTNKFHAERRARLDASLNPGLTLAFQQYMDQQQQGTSTSRVVPVTTRGIGFHVALFMADARKHIPRIELPPRANVHQLYRYSLMQTARQLVLAEPGPQHTLTPRMPRTPRVSAFSAHRNGTFLADAISQLGNFRYDNITHQTYIPELTLSIEGKKRVLQPIYPPTSPGATPSKRPLLTPENSVYTEVDHVYSIPDPYHITIFNLRDAVVQLSNPECPVELRRRFIERNPIPGSVFSQDLLMNPDEVMPCAYFEYIRQTFGDDIADCHSLFDQMAAVNPACVGNVTMDGRGSELNLVTVRTPPGQEFRVDGDDIVCEGQSHMYAGFMMSNVNRLRSCVNLMTEVPLLSCRTFVDSSFAFRDPSLAIHSFVEQWPTLAWNVSPFVRSQ